MANSRRSIVVTGAASGIGLATATLFAERGWMVAAVDVDDVALARLTEQLGSDDSLVRRVDVTDRDDVLAAFDAVGEWTGDRLDLLFANAGIDSKGPFGAADWLTLRRVVEVNLLGTMSVIHAGLPLLQGTEGSMCLLTASASAIFGTAGLAAYSATKHGVRGLTEALAVELAPHGCRAADIVPGIVETGMLDPSVKASLPTTGPWRPLPATEVAEVAWAAYHDAGHRLHWFIPEELGELDVRARTTPEAVRDDRIAGRFS